MRERLAQALRSIPRPAPVLAALPLSAQQRLQTRLAGLDAERKLSVHSDDSALVETLPLLHLVSGGASPRALYALATTPAGSEEVAGLGLESGSPGPASKEDIRVSVVRDLAQRAALNFLRDRAADVALPGKRTPLVCRLVARAALAVGRRDLALLAHELLLEVEPSTETRLEFAQELAKDGQAERASRVLAEATTDKRHPASAGARAAVQQLIDSARVATTPAAPGAAVSARLARARAWLRLGRVSEARQVLASDAEAAKGRLDLAATLAETMTEFPSCPDLPPDVGNAELCSLAFGSNQRMAAARSLLEQAWSSGAGRDDAAVEVYVALELVLPWLHRTTQELVHGTLNPIESAVGIAELRDKIAKMSSTARWLSGLSLFLETVHSGGATAGAAAARSPAQAQELAQRALSLAATDPSRFAQAGVLAVAATLSRQQDVSALIDALPFEQMTPALRVPRVALEAWAAATSEARPRMETARTELAEIMAGLQGSSLERARLVLTVSEADALFDSSQRSYQLLSRVSGQLLSDNIPPDLALRAVLDAAGALAHGERFEQAQKILSGAAGAELPPNLQRSADLLQLIRGYKLVLTTHGATADALPQARKALAELATGVKGETAAVWFELWLRELDAVQRDTTCAKKKQRPCKEADALRRDARAGLDERLGAEASFVLLRGALAGGSFDAGFRFSVEYGLEPLVSFDPSFLAIGLPRFTAN
ncbi:MAG: hypothetical protein ABI488_23190 [Polyangiaceae bacterium]